MKIYEVTDAEFKQFGRVLSLDTAEIVAVGEQQEMPAEGSQYVPTLDAFEKLPIQKVIEDQCFGGVPAQIGYCWGHNDTLNALEWHTCSEINIAVRDLILLLGDVRDMDVVLLDDIVDTAGTLCMAAKVIRDAGAKSVRAILSHGVMSGKADEKIMASELQEVVFTDSIQYDQSRCSKVKVVSLAEPLAETILAIQEHRSISEVNVG